MFKVDHCLEGNWGKKFQPSLNIWFKLRISLKIQNNNLKNTEK